MHSSHPAIADSVRELEPLPPTVMRLASLLAVPDWEVEQIEECVALDQALTAKLLRIANSPLWFRGHPIGSVRQAVMRMGSGTLIALAMGAGVQRRFSRALPQYGLREGELWTHSVACALAANALALAAEPEFPSETFASALLHDVGKLVTVRTVARDSGDPRDLARRKADGSPPDDDLDVRACDHAALGGVTAVHWRLPERLVTGVSFHHAPLEMSDPIASLVHVADVVAHRIDVISQGGSEQAFPREPAAGVLERLALRPVDLDRIVAEVGERLSDVLRRFA